MYVKVTNGKAEKYSLSQLRKDNPQVSFPDSFPQSVLDEYNVYPFIPQQQPSCDLATESIVEGTPIKQGNDWIQTWNVVRASNDEIAYRKSIQEESIRDQRNQKLQETDWRFRSDMNPSQEWKDYCQALRDITKQAGFPWNVSWPIEPK